jgi:hypothetical protein
MKTLLLIAVIAIASGCRTVDYLPKFNTATDEFKIETAVYSYLLEKNVGENPDYGAIFLKGSDEEVTALIRTFPTHVPPLKTSERVLFQPNRTPIDKDTGKPALILSAEAAGPFADKAEAIGSWYSGPNVTGHYIFELRKLGSDWQIESVK